jgi:predicted RNA-binding protein YlxR (DUF448 family)
MPGTTAADKPRPASRKRGPQPRRVPQRTCVGCRTVQPKRQLVRLVRNADGSVAIDPTGKAAGRGAYLHDRAACWELALRNRALEHALKTDLTEADRARLRAHGEQYHNDDE